MEAPYLSASTNGVVINDDDGSKVASVAALDGFGLLDLRLLEVFESLFHENLFGD